MLKFNLFFFQDAAACGATKNTALLIVYMVGDREVDYDAT